MRKRLRIVSSTIIFLLVFFWAENNVSQFFQSCVTSEHTHQSTNNPNKSRFVIGRFVQPQIVCSIRFADDHAGFIAALAGIAVAIFTLTLKWSTDKLWNAHRETHEAEQRAFVSLDGFNVELRTLANADVDSASLPYQLKLVDKELHITGFSVQPRWKNNGNTSTINMTINSMVGEIMTTLNGVIACDLVGNYNFNVVDTTD